MLRASMVGSLLLASTAAASGPASPGATRVSPVDGMTLVRIPAGEFLMGASSREIDAALAECSHCRREWFDHETPQHPVSLDEYWIDRTEVTNAMFARFVAAIGYRTEGERLGSGIVFSLASKDWRMVRGADWRHPQGPGSSLEGLEDHPVVHVTQDDAIAYCEWAGRRLPTEAEWEKAARGVDGRTYPWGDGPPTGARVNTADRSLSVWSVNPGTDDGAAFTARVGSHLAGASPYGVLDLAGNVAERVADRYGETYYATAPRRDPAGPWTGEHVVMRGGSWSRAIRYLRAASRVRYHRGNRSAGLGFRCAVSGAAPVVPETGEHLVFGSARVPVAPPGLAPALAAFLGRWEGYDEGPPVRRDLKLVLVVQEIGPEEGKALVWMGTNLQYPSAIQEVRFRVRGEARPELVIEAGRAGDAITFALVHDAAKDRLTSPPDTLRRFVLGRGRSFSVFADHARWLGSKRIEAVPYPAGSTWRLYGEGYLRYLPEGYEQEPDRRWPLLLFLHGAGDRGRNLLALAKASPFMTIREKGPLPLLIVAPLLDRSESVSSFPESYLDGVLELALTDYRVDPTRIYVTGLSMGGEATYRLALHRPDTFAAIAPLCAYLSPLPSMEKLRDLPVWAIHGAEDSLVSVRAGARPVEALRGAGNDHVRFTVLEGHDHDVWTDTYLDPAFYRWLLEQRRP